MNSNAFTAMVRRNSPGRSGFITARANGTSPRQGNEVYACEESLLKQSHTIYSYVTLLCDSLVSLCSPRRVFMRLIHAFASSKHFSISAISQSVSSSPQYVVFDSDEFAGECKAGDPRINGTDTFEIGEIEVADSMLDLISSFSLSSKVRADSELVSASENVIVNLRR
jgi:hypothetical protein